MRDEQFIIGLSKNNGLEEKLDALQKQLAEFLDEKNIQATDVTEDITTILVQFIQMAVRAI